MRSSKLKVKGWQWKLRVAVPVTVPVAVAMLLVVASTRATAQTMDANAVLASIDQKAATYRDVAMKIWSWAEVGYQEAKSSALLQEQLKAAGFTVATGVAEIPTAFTATWGAGKPVIGIIGEFDALPGLSQAASPEREAILVNGPGHGCGHHLFGTASTAAAIAVKQWLAANQQSGTLRFYGTPAEEGGAGKVYMLRAGLFDDVDAVVTMHPGDRNAASASTDLGDVSWRVPTVQMTAATWVPGTPAHSWQAVAAGGMSIGVKGMMVAAKGMTLMAMDLFSDPAHLAKARAEFEKRRGSNFKYTTRLADRKPALDYRK